MPATTTSRQQAQRLAHGVVLAYVLAGTAWILLSDAAVRAVSIDAGWLAAAQRFKGLAFVVVTALALLALLRLANRRLLLAVQQGQHSALRVQDLFECHPQPMWYHAQHSQALLRVNAAAQRLYGYSQAEFLQMTVPMLRHPDACEAPGERPHSHPAGIGIADQVQHRRKTGELLQVQISAQNAPYAGQPAVLVLAIDISAQVAAQQALQQQAQQMHALHQSLAEVLWLTSADGQQLLYVSPAFASVYGLPAAAFQQDPRLWLAHVHPDDRATAQASVQQLMDQGSAECEYRIQRADGQLRWLSDRKTLVRDAQGRPSMVAGIAEDITQRRGDQDALRRQTDELAARYAELARFNQAAVDREIDMIALKREVNALAQAQQLPAPYRLDFSGHTAVVAA